MATSQELLDEVNAAISAVLTNQSYSIRGRTYTRADLGQLRLFRRELRQEVLDEGGDGGSMSTLGRLDPRS